MKILFLLRLFYPHLGGVEKHVLEISKNLVKKGHRVVVVTEQLSTKNIPVYLHLKNVPLVEKFGEIKIYRMPVGKDDWFKKFRIWSWLWKNRKLIIEADIVHAHDVFFWYLPFRFLYPKKKIFTTFHGYESFPVSKKAIFVRKISEKLSFGNICIGDFIKKWYGTKPTYTIYGGVNIIQKKEFSPRFGEAGRIQNQNSSVFVGRLDEQTGFLTYLEAVKKIREKFPDFKFSVFGDGKFRNRIPSYVYFRGFVEDAEKEISKYNFVFASRYLAILEALAAKRPIIAVYDNPIKRDYLKMSPFAKYIAIEKSGEKAAEKIYSLLEDSNRTRGMIDAGFEWAKDQSWEKVANLYLKLWVLRPKVNP